jgi:hypothetical protein
MGRVRLATPGLTLEDHRELAAELDALQEATVDLRTRVRDAEGTASLAYTTGSRVIASVKAWRAALARELITEYGDRPEVQALYHGDGTP